MIFDFIIMDATNGEKCLDDVMKKLYADYLANPHQGVTENSLLQVFSNISNIDFSPYFKKYLHTTDSLDIETYFELLGINILDINNKQVHLGLATQWKEGKLIITELDKNYGAYLDGLNVGDEIIAIDGFRVMADFGKVYEQKKVDDNIDVIISRQGILKSYKVTLTANRQRNITFEVSNNVSVKQQTLLNKWLQKNEM
jgi:predicted metalloprotease with PDZ domain